MKFKQFIKKLKLTVIENFVYESVAANTNINLTDGFVLKVFDQENPSGIGLIDRNCTKESCCYALFSEKKLAHYTLLYKKNFLSEQLKFDNDYYVVASFTYPEFRGRNLYGFVLAYLVNKYSDKKIIGFVDITNNASIKAFMKAGFICKYKFKLIRLFGLKIYLKKYAC